MIKVVIDYDTRMQKGIIQSNYLDNIREHFSVENKNAYITRMRTGNKFIPSRHYVITPSGRFDFGLYNEIKNYIQSLQIPIELIVTDLFNKYYNSNFDFKDNELQKLQLTPAEHQLSAIRNCLQQGFGNVVVGTGGGKTFIIATLVSTIRKYSNPSHKTLIIVPNVQLVEQTYKDFINYGIDPNLISCRSGKHETIGDINAITIANLGILESKKQDIGWVEKIDLLIIDEVHKLRKDNKFNKIIDKIKTRHKYGFTGTMPEDKIDIWNIIGKIGPILYEKPSNELRDESFLTNALIQILYLQHKVQPEYPDSTISNPTLRWDAENDFIYNNKWRNTVIAKLANKLDGNVLILVDRLIHGDELLNNITQCTNKEVYFIKGEVEIEERERIRDLMEGKDNVICIAMSSIFATGINIKNLPYIIFALAGKAKVKIIQSIGRGLRLHENKNRLIIFDIVDNLIYSMKHLEKRLKLYNEEKIQCSKKVIQEA